MYDSVAFSTFIILCSHQLYPVQTSSPPQKETLYPLSERCASRENLSHFFLACCLDYHLVQNQRTFHCIMRSIASCTARGLSLCCACQSEGEQRERKGESARGRGERGLDFFLRTPASFLSGRRTQDWGGRCDTARTWDPLEIGLQWADRDSFPAGGQI